MSEQKPVGDNNRPMDYDIPAPTSKNRKWLTKDGLVDAGGQFKDGKKVEPVLDVDIQ